MDAILNGLKIHFEEFISETNSENNNGESSVVTLLLHGWGADSSTLRGVFEHLKEHNKSVAMLDLPLFGKSDFVSELADFFTYTSIVEEFIKQRGYLKVNLLGHSFGGKIAIYLSSNSKIKNSIEKLVLVSCSGVKPKRSLCYYLKVYWYKIKKWFGVKSSSSGSSDYNALPENLRGVFVRIVNTHLNKYLDGIAVPTLLIWGENDADTPVYMAEKIKRKVIDSALVMLSDAGHYSFLDKPTEFNSIVNAFI